MCVFLQEFVAPRVCSCPWKAQEGIRSPGARAADVESCLTESWELNPAPAELLWSLVLSGSSAPVSDSGASLSLRTPYLLNTCLSLLLIFTSHHSVKSASTLGASCEWNPAAPSEAFCYSSCSWPFTSEPRGFETGLRC